MKLFHKIILNSKGLFSFQFKICIFVLRIGLSLGYVKTTYAWMLKIVPLCLPINNITFCKTKSAKRTALTTTMEPDCCATADEAKLISSHLCFFSEFLTHLPKAKHIKLVFSSKSPTLFHFNLVPIYLHPVVPPQENLRFD